MDVIMCVKDNSVGTTTVNTDWHITLILAKIFNQILHLQLQIL